MTVGTEVATSQPAVIRAIRVETEMMRHVDRAPASLCEDEAEWWGRRGRGLASAACAHIPQRGPWATPGNGLGSLERFGVGLAGLKVG
jgi:hypothetical protein